MLHVDTNIEEIPEIVIEPRPECEKFNGRQEVPGIDSWMVAEIKGCAVFWEGDHHA